MRRSSSTAGSSPQQAPGQRATWRSVLCVGEFRALWLAHFLSLLGDQFARIALTVMVFRSTRSPLLAAAVLAVTLLPWLVGGPLLSGLADRHPRRQVMVGASLISAGLTAVLAIPGLPAVALVAVLFAVILCAPPFAAARAALLADVFPDERYTLVQSVNHLTVQGCQVLGFAAGGVLTAALGPRPALLADAGTFLVAAMVIRLGSPTRAAPVPVGTIGAGWLEQLRSGTVEVFRDRTLRRLALLAWLAAFWVVPQGLAAPYAASVGGGAETTGLFLAAQPVGMAVGAVIVGRMLSAEAQLRLLVPLAALAGLPLVGCFAAPPLQVTLGLLIVAGFGSSYQLIANARFMLTVRASMRAQTFGLVATGLTVGQGVGLLVGGAVAERVDPLQVIGWAGAVGLLVLAAHAVTLAGSGREATACSG
jgi:predicted MFS family arabinose efflux permease